MRASARFSVSEYPRRLTALAPTSVSCFVGNDNSSVSGTKMRRRNTDPDLQQFVKARGRGSDPESALRPILPFLRRILHSYKCLTRRFGPFLHRGVRSPGTLERRFAVYRLPRI